jgi:hypothetical protein
MLAARAGLVSGLPLMHRTFYIRLARVEEAAAVSDLCFCSKAVWGYDPEFMALMPPPSMSSQNTSPAGDVWIATGDLPRMIGICSERKRPFFVPSPAIRFPERAEGVKGPKR